MNLCSILPLRKHNISFRDAAAPSWLVNKNRYEKEQEEIIQTERNVIVWRASSIMAKYTHNVYAAELCFSIIFCIYIFHSLFFALLFSLISLFGNRFSHTKVYINKNVCCEQVSRHANRRNICIRIDKKQVVSNDCFSIDFVFFSSGRRG